MIPRNETAHKIKLSFKQNPVTALLGPRQCGKTTLARLLTSTGKANYFDLENPVDQARLENPIQSLSEFQGFQVIDEIQKSPKLFEVLRVLSDRKPIKSRFLILGSASMELIKHASETLAGRIGFIEMGGFLLPEVGIKNLKKLWLRGGFPKSFLAKTESESQTWRENFIRTFLERDIPQLGIRIPPQTLRRFWSMVAHYHGQTWNASEIGASLSINHVTARHYLDILTGAFVLRQLQPWHENAGKRVVKAPKIYIRDSGLLHSFLGITSLKNLEGHPKLGASWEGFVVEQILTQTGGRDAYFWATHGGAELDLFLLKKGKRWGFEIKYSDAPRLTKSMAIAQKDLRLDHFIVIYPGTQSYNLSKKIKCIGLAEFQETILPKLV